MITMLKHQDSKTSKGSDTSIDVFKPNKSRKSLKSRILSLRKKKQDLECFAYENNPMDLIQEEKERRSITLTAEVFKKDIGAKLLEPFRWLSKPDRLFATVDSEIVLDEEYLKNASLRDKNYAFLLAAFKGALNYLQILLELGVDPSYADDENLNGLHLAALSGSVDCCSWLLSEGCPIRSTDDGLYPMHFAVQSNSVEVTRWLLSVGCEIPATVLHSATCANAADCVSFVLRHRIAVNAYDGDGKTALHIAADLGHTECLKYIVEDKRINVNATTKPGENTALHYAAENGYLDCLESLLAKNAFVDATNADNRTALHRACSAANVDCVKTLLKAGASVDVQDSNGRTPSHAAVSRSPQSLRVVRTLVEWKANIQLADKDGFTPLHMAASNELEECVEYLVMSGANAAAITNGGVSALNIMKRKTPVSLGSVQQRLNLSLSYTRQQTLKLNFRDFMNNSTVGEVGYLFTVQQDLPDFLKHPLCRAFLHLKWQKVRSLYLIRIVVSLSVICLLSFYVLTAITKECHNVLLKHNETEMLNSSCNASFLSSRTLVYTSALRINWYLVVFAILLNVIRICFSFAAYKSVGQYFSEHQNLFELTIIVCVFVLCLKDVEGNTYDWQNIVGALTVLLGWIYLMTLIGQLPFFGTYVAMFAKVLQEFSKMLVVFFCLLVGFTITFCILLPGDDNFENPIRGLVKIIAMMAGELDFNDATDAIKDMVLVKYVTLLVLTMFVVFVTIVLMNLLVGIAVQDVEGLRNTADMSKLVQQMQLIYFLELACFHGCFPRNIMEIFRKCLYWAPGSYRVVEYVRPFDPRDKKLPKDVIEDALKIALERSRARLNLDKPLKMENRIERLEKEFAKVKDTIVDVHTKVEKIDDILNTLNKIYSLIKQPKQEKSVLVTNSNTLTQ